MATLVPFIRREICPLPDAPTTWHDVAAIGDLPEGGLIEVVAGGAVLAVANIGGELFAIDGVCAHQGGPLGKGRLEGGCLTCPWHGWQYDARTGRQLLSQTIKQRRFAVRTEADRIQVGIPDD